MEIEVFTDSDGELFNVFTWGHVNKDVFMTAVNLDERAQRYLVDYSMEDIAPTHTYIAVEPELADVEDEKVWAWVTAKTKGAEAITSLSPDDH